MDIPKIGRLNAFAFYVDVNGFSGMVREAEESGDIIAQFTRDCLSGSISMIEGCGGEVVGFMGDAIYGVIADGKKAVEACFGIAKDLDSMCEYISGHQGVENNSWEFCKGGPSLKIGIEYGALDVSTIYSNFLGEHPLLIGSAINYAARITKAGVGNRCLVGPVAAGMEFSSYGLIGPHKIKGKRGEGEYEYFQFPMDDVWIEGPRRKSRETFWG